MFYLTREEVLRESRGDYISDSLSTLIERRKAEHSQNQDISQEPAFKGTPCVAGVVHAPIKFAKEPGQDLRGKIVVVDRMGPQWPYLSGARGILVRKGSVHSTLAAHQMGIPCVVAGRDPRSVFKDGQLVTMDGASGEVRTVSRAKEPDGGVLPPIP